MNISCPRSRLRVWSREKGLTVLSRVSLLILYTQTKIWCLLAGFLPISAAASMYLYRYTPSGQSRVYQVTQLRTDDVHCRASVRAGPVALKLVPVTGVSFAGYHGPIIVRLSFPTLAIGMEWVCCVIQKVSEACITPGDGGNR